MTSVPSRSSISGLEQIAFVLFSLVLHTLYRFFKIFKIVELATSKKDYRYNSLAKTKPSNIHRQQKILLFYRFIALQSVQVEIFH